MKRGIAALNMVVALLSGCGGSDNAGPVAYGDTTLVVNGARYERPIGIYACEGMSDAAVCRTTSSRPIYVSKTVILQMNTTDEKAVIDILTAYGLYITRRSELSAIAELPALTTLVITVPMLFEEQWVQALRSESRIVGAWTNDLYYVDTWQQNTVQLTN
jgi:hypothetical protein